MSEEAPASSFPAEDTGDGGSASATGRNWIVAVLTPCTVHRLRPFKVRPRAVTLGWKSPLTNHRSANIKRKRRINTYRYESTFCFGLFLLIEPFSPVLLLSPVGKSSGDQRTVGGASHSGMRNQQPIAPWPA